MKKYLSYIPFLDRLFDPGTREYYYLLVVLVAANLFLTIAAVVDVFGFPIHEWIQVMENAFALLFLIEFLLALVFTYVPEKKVLSFDSIISMLVIGSLMAPAFVGNLAFLRLMVIFRVFHKFYSLNQLEKKRGGISQSRKSSKL